MKLTLLNNILIFRIFYFIFVLIYSSSSFAQSPHSFKYQAVVRDANGAAISNSSVGVMINIYMDSCNGNNVYRETFVVTSNDYGLINLNVGEGQVISPTPIGALNWSSGSFFIETSIDLTGSGSNFQYMSCSQLLSVPYALYAENAGSSTPGPQGVTGPTGSGGSTGPTGPIGPPGATGLQGIQGATGPQGLPGVTGSVGLQGVTGPAGATGLQGPTGPPGATGSSATNHDWYGASTTSPAANINDDIYTNGNVGIGKNNPQTSLDVVGTATITNQTDGAVLLDLNSERNWQFKQLGTGAASSLELASINGGGNKNFVINTLGNVGVGTQTPQKKLDVSGNRADLLLKTTESSAMNGDVLSSILFYNDDMSSGATGKRIGSGIRYRAQDDYGRGQLEFTNSTTNPSSSWNDTPNYSDNTVTRMVIKYDGKIGMGTTSPARNLEIENNGSYVGLKIQNTDATSAWSILEKDNNMFTIFQDGENYHRLTIDSSGNVGIGTTTPAYKLHVYGRIKTSGITESSDERLKENINDLTASLEKVLQLRGVTYNWKDKNEYSSATQIGLIAQEVKKIIPELVDQDQQGLYSVQYSHLVPLLVEAIKELNTLLGQTQQNVLNLEDKVAENKEEIQQLNQVLLDIYGYLGIAPNENVKKDISKK